jgi:hypothetical protein
MRYLAIFTPSKTARPQSGHSAEMEKFVEASYKSGELVSTGGLLPLSSGGVRAQCEGGQITILDGPYAEAKEAVVGYAILNLPTREAVVESIKRFLKVAGDGQCEVHPIMDAPPPEPC